MAAEEEMPLSLPNTQNADILTQSQPTTQETHSQQVRRVWGKLYPFDTTLNQVELIKNLYTLGRALHCDIVISADTLNDKYRSVISKQHFKITREILNGALEESVVYLEDTSFNGTFVNDVPVGRGKKVILENNDNIALARPGLKIFTFISSRTSDSSGLPPELKCKYTVSRTLGSGACGEVKMLLLKFGCQRFALKTIPKSKFLSGEKKNPFNDPGKIMTEVQILKALRHPCIIKMVEILDTPSSVYIVLELMQGGELFDRIRKKESGLSEKHTKIIFYQVVLAVHYLHGQNIAHRDLKPENILLATDEDITLVKVSDFGLSKFVDTQTMMRTFCGTPMYVAPEVLLTHGKGSYTNQVDVWSLGVILYCCLSGLVPFSNHDKEVSLQQQIIKGKYNFPRHRFSGVSPRAMNLISRMLTVSPEKRITVGALLLHPWLQDREMRSTVGSLLRQADEPNENEAPRVDPPVAVPKRSRVDRN